MAGGKSLVLITVDCLRADHCGFMGYPRPTTPFLDELSRESLVFPTAIAAGVPTYYSFPATLASRYPLALGREIVGLAPEEENLASTLRKQGYSTAFFGAGNPYLSKRFGYDYGFDLFRDHLDDDRFATSNQGQSRKRNGWLGNLNRVLNTVSHKMPGLGAGYDELYFQYCQRWNAPQSESLDQLRRFPSADQMVDEAAMWLKSHGENPFFLWLHFMDPHSPYYPTDKAVEMFGGKPLSPSRARSLNAFWNRGDIDAKRLRHHHEEIIELYDICIRWVDAQIARLVGVMRELELWRNCILAVTADHGEEFLEHDRCYHAPALVEKLIHVPLFVRVPGVGSRPLSSVPFSLLHLAPTLLAAAGIASPASFQGRSHWENIEQGTPWEGPAISECIAGGVNPYQAEKNPGTRMLTVREQRYKLSINFENGTDDLFDLETDPKELSPLPLLTGKAHRRRLLESARTHLQHSVARERSESYLRARLQGLSWTLAAPQSSQFRAAG